MAEVAFSAVADLRTTQQFVAVAFSVDAPDFFTTQQSTEVLLAAENEFWATQQSTEVLLAAENEFFTTQQSVEVLYRGVCSDVEKDETRTPGLWTPTPAHTEVDLGCLSSSLSPSSDQLVIGFEAIVWDSSYSMELSLLFNKANSDGDAESDGDEISLVVQFSDGITPVWTHTFLDVQGFEGRIVHSFTVAEKALISTNPDLIVSITADTTSSGTTRKIMLCEVGLCWSGESGGSSSSSSDSEEPPDGDAKFCITVNDGVIISNEVTRIAVVQAPPP